MTTALPTSSPSEQGVDAAGVLALLDALEAAPQVEMHSLMVLRHGHVVAEGWWSPYSADRPHLLYSLSKSVTSTALGLAVAEGRVGLDDLVVDHLPDLAEGVTDPRTRSTRLRHLASMATGHLADTWEAALALDPTDPARGFLRLPPERDPGTLFTYNQPATYTLATILQRVTGQTLTDYLRPRLLDPLGIGPVGWQQLPPGRDVGFTGLHATTDAVARLGQLYLQRGRWHGRPILSADWVAEATRRHVATDRDDISDPDWRQGYGFQFWMSQHGFRGDGAFGQFCLVLPEQDAVVAILSDAAPMQRVLDAVWEHLLPALRSAAPDLAAEPVLLDRLAGLAVAPFRAAAEPAHRAPWAATRLVPAGGRCADQPSLTEVEVAHDGPSWQLTLVEHGSRLTFPVGTDGWRLSEPGTAGGTPVPVAASGGFTEAGTLRVEVLFIETPHRLVVVGDAAAGTFEARWVTAPLRAGSLDELRCPTPG